MGHLAFKDRPFFRRLLEVDSLLRGSRPVTCSSLAKRWGTSTKTAQRFIDQMRDEFDAPIEFSREGKRFVYSDQNFRLPWVPVDGKDLFAIAVAARVLQIYEGTPAARDLRAVYERLASALPGEIRVRPSSLVERVYVHPGPIRSVAPEIWERVAEALQQTTALQITYQPPAGGSSVREIEPYCLVAASTNWLLAARDPADDTVKTFYLSRIRKASSTGRRYVIPKTFSPTREFGESIGIYVGEGTFRFHVRFAAEIAAQIEEVRWHEKQKLTRLPTGEVELELPTESIYEAKKFVLSFGRFATAIAPDELIREVERDIRELAAKYGSSSAERG